MNYPKEKRKENASISQLALEYYKKYGQNRDLQQYFVLSTPINLSREDIIEEEVPKIIVDEVVETGRLSSASSCVSDKRLEWDSGADVGYHNYYVKEKSSSLPSLSMVPGGESTPKTLTFQFLKDDENDITPILKKSGSKSLEDTRVISPVNLNQKSISEQSITKNPLIENIFIVPLRNNYCSTESQTQEMVEKQSDKSDVYFTAEDPDHESGSVESVTSESCSSGKSLGSILMASQYSTNLSKDLQSTIDVLKTIIDTKKYSSKDKKRLIKRIVKKIVNTDYDDDSTDDILKQNVPWTPVSFATTVTPNTKLEQTIEELGEMENDNPPPGNEKIELSPVEQPITWKEDITLSEKLFQERVKQIQEQRRKQKTPYTIQKFQTEILKHKFQEGDASQNKDFLEYTESERKKQLEWVKSELYHLNQLKILLEETEIESATIPEERTSKGAIPKTVPVEVFSQQSSDKNLREDTCSTGTEFSYSEIRSVGEYSDLINVQSKDRSVQTSPELKSQRFSNISSKSVQVEPVYIDTGVQVGTIRSDRTTKSRKSSSKTPELPSPVERKSPSSVKTQELPSPVERKSLPSVKTPELPSPVATKSPSMYSTKSVQVDSSFNGTDQLTIQSNRPKSKSPEVLLISPEIRTRTSSINSTKSVQPSIKLSDRTTKPPTGRSITKSESQRISELASRVEQLDTALQNLQNKDSKSSSSNNSLPESLKFFIEIDRKAHAKITRKPKHSEPMRISGGSSPDDLRHRVAEMLSRCDKCNNRTHCLCPEYKIIDPVAEKTRKNIENCGYSGNGCHCCGKRNSSYFLRVESRSDLVLEEKVDWEKRGKKTTEQVNIFVPKMIKKGEFYEPNNIGTFVEYQDPGKKYAPLKDFLLLNRPKFVEDADKRRGYILDRMSERQLKSDIFKDHIRKTAPSDINRFNLELLRTQKFRSLPKKRFFTTKKMKDMTKKHYRKCTEVLEHKAGYKHRQDIKTNLFMKQLFAMKLQQNVRKGKLDHSFSKNVI